MTEETTPSMEEMTSSTENLSAVMPVRPGIPPLVDEPAIIAKLHNQIDVIRELLRKKFPRDFE